MSALSGSESDMIAVSGADTCAPADSESAAEQAHLSCTYAKLKDMEAELSGRVLELSEKVPEEKRDIRDSLSLNFDSSTDTMETYIEFEVMNHVIDLYNIESDSAREKLTRIRKLLEKPYFARVILKFDGEDEPESYYIGAAEASENGYEPLVIDWRSPIAETYYSQQNGRTSYEVDGRRISVELLLRRQFDIVRDRLLAFFDTSIAIEDPLLIASLSRHRSDKLQAITATIQSEQNEIIRYPDVPVMLVGGIAGSGKTSVLLQRLAYLFYRQRGNLRPQDVYLITVNPVFRRYIDEVLPDMGEHNPITMTFTEFLDAAGVPGRGDEGISPDPESLRKIDELLPSLTLTKEDFLPVRQGNFTVLSASAIAALIGRFSHLPTGIRLIQVVIDEMLEAAKRSIRRHERLSGDNEAPKGTTDNREENRIQSSYGGAFQAIRKCSWLNIGRIGTRLLSRQTLSRQEWYYIKMALTGECDRNIRFCLIDEVQDYTLSQLMILKRYFINAHFMMLGDEFQSIREGTAAFDGIVSLFEEGSNAAAGRAGGAAVSRHFLNTSYRSSPEITDLFAGLLPKDRQILISSVQRPGIPPVIRAFGEHTEYITALCECVRAAKKSEGGLTAVICADEKSLEKTAAITKLPALRRRDALPESGIFLISLLYAKGLEFDSVILPDADAANYPDDILGRRRLYTALSRATQHLTVLADGELTPLLDASPSRASRAE